METQKLSAEELDEQRKRKQAYEYLCHLEEAKIWLENVLKKNLGASCDLEQSLRNGVDLALLATVIAPEKCSKTKIYDLDLKKFEDKGLHFKYTDNIMMFLKGCIACGLPKIFIPETLDLYDAKNTAKVIFCIHALAHYLAKKGVLPLITNLYGQVEFGEHEISQIQKYLEKSGMKMPAFSKIGGILAGELSEDDAAIHAAIMLISEAIEKDDYEIYMDRLKSSALNFLRVRDFNGRHYFEDMKERKKRKVEQLDARQAENPQEEDVYDRILSRSEIQDSISTINITELVNLINEAVRNNDYEALTKIYETDDFYSMGAQSNNCPQYAANTLKEYSEMEEKRPLTSTDIENIIRGTNSEMAMKKVIDKFVGDINSAIDAGDMAAIILILKKPPKTYDVLDFEHKSSLIFESLKEAKDKEGGHLTSKSLEKHLKKLKIICQINNSLDRRDEKELGELLADPSMEIEDVDKEMSSRYLESLLKVREAKSMENKSEGGDLKYEEIVSCINAANREVQEEMRMLDIVSKINESLKDLSPEDLLLLLLDPLSKFQNVQPENRDAYYQALLKEKERLELETGSAHAFWHNNIQEVIDNYNGVMSKVREEVGLINELNESLISGNDRKIPTSVVNLGVGGVIPECHSKYFKAMKTALDDRKVEKWNGWLGHTFFIKDYKPIYYNHKTNEYKLFEPPAEYKESIGYLNSKQVVEICNRVGSEFNRELYFKSNIDSIITIQSMYITCNIYRRYHHHLNFVNEELPKIIILQGTCRTITKRTEYQNRLKFIRDQQEEANALKLYFKALGRRRNFKIKIVLYKKSLHEIIGLQSLIRTFVAHNDYYSLINMTSQSLKQVYKYLHLLEFDENDIIEEREVTRLRNLVFDKIKEAGDAEEEVKSRYLLIGVLINNRQSLKNIEAESSKSKRSKRSNNVTQISKEKIEIFEKYGNIFYILQHKPEYISRLLLRIASTRSTKFMREYFLTIFNFGTTSRDEYLMLRALGMCLDYEVTTNIASINELSKDDPAAFKIAISFWRDVKAPTFLHDMLAEPINDILRYKGVITVNPVDVYKQWLSKIESETGKSSDLPYDVEPEIALKHDEVQNQIKKNIELVIEMATNLRDSVIKNRDLIPYGIRYFSKCIYDSLNSKFEDAPEVEKLKVVANLLYYRFINPPTVSPEAFNLLKDKTEVSTEERRNLAQISSILQKASAYVLSEGGNPILKPLDDFVKDSAKKFMAFFKMCIEVPPLEQHYNINQFTDRTQVRVPELKVTFNIILETHRLLLEHSDIVFPNDEDILHNIIKDMNEVPELTSIVDYRPPDKTPGKGDKKAAENEIVENIEEILGNSMTILALVPPKALLETDENKHEELLNDTINKIVDILHFSACETIAQVLKSTFTTAQEEKYKDMLIKREKIVQERLENDVPIDSGPDESSEFMTLSETLGLVLENVAQLEELKVIKPDNDYQDILLAIVKKIIQRTQYVKSRKAEIARFRSTYDDLQNKISNLAKQLEYYNMYIKGCITNMAQRKKTKKKSIKRSAQKLIQKGVIVDIEGISPDKFKNVMVVISTTDEPGVYEISGEFIGISVDTYKCRINFQDLLQLKFDNVAVLRIMNIVKVRVNLLIHMINVEFHV